jgi:hypothetical protein
MSTFFAGNRKLIGIAEQADADTPASAPSYFFQITEFAKEPVRTQAPLEETDASTQQGRNHVTAITPGFTLGLYGRPSEIDVIARSVLWTGTATATSHSSTSTPDQTPVYWTVWEIEPDLYTNRWDGCVGVAVSFTAQDEGQTELRVNGWQFLALGFLAGVAEPTLPAVSTELPYIYAECAVSYDSVSPGTTSAFTVNISRNAKRIQGDNGFRSLAVVPGKLQVDGTLTRYVLNDDIMRAVDTGAAAGTSPTTTIYDESLDILFERPADSVSLLIASAGIAYPTREQATNLDGSPLAEVLGFQTQPQTDAADNISIVAVG